MNDRIIEFLKKQSNLTLCTCLGEKPYCASCFYAFHPDKPSLVIKSSATTRHIREAIKNPDVAGTVVPDKLLKGKIQGLQFQGTLRKADPSEENSYYKKYPFARVISGEVWGIDLVHVKMTDNTLGFGTKLEWSAIDPIHN